MDNLQSGINAFKSGQKDEARKFFIAAIKENPQNENVWGWMYQVAKSDEERVECLKRAIAINPQNIKAKELLDKLTAPPPLTIPPIATPRETPQVIQPQKIIAPVVEKKKSNPLYLAVFAIVSVFLVLCCLIAVFGNSNGTPTSTNSGGGGGIVSGLEIKYVIKGTASSAFLTYFNATGGTEQQDIYIPFEMNMNVDFGAPLSLVAQNSGAGSITCEIWVNGQLAKTSTSTAEYGIVTCSDFAK